MRYPLSAATADEGPINEREGYMPTKAIFFLWDFARVRVNSMSAAREFLRWRVCGGAERGMDTCRGISWGFALGLRGSYRGRVEILYFSGYMLM